jgi:nucleotide-binding universal stress UspA family protein
VNIYSMLVRLQTKLNLGNLAEEILLLPPQPQHALVESDAINLLVGYSNSRTSQLALDLTLCIALQTRLVVSHPVTVQVVYVAEEPTPESSSNWIAAPNRKQMGRSDARTAVMERALVRDRKMVGKGKRFSSKTLMSKAEQFEKADSILWQARSLAEEWRGSLKTHLRFGDLATELGEVAAAEKATLLILGCESKAHPLVSRLGSQFPCPILGIPAEFQDE